MAYLELLCEEVGDKGGEGGKEGGKEDADVADINADVKKVQELVDEGGRDHEPRIDGAADDAAERIPCAVIKPVVEVEETFLNKVLGGAVVEVGVKLVDHALKPDHSKQSRQERCLVPPPNNKKNGGGEENGL